MTEIKLNDKKLINGWAFFDWANSAYALVVTAAIFPAYFINMTDDIVKVMGVDLTNSGLYAFSVTFSYLIMVFITPLLSGISDYTGRKKFFLRFFTIIGSLACMSLFFFKGMPTIWVGVIGFILATIGFSGGLVFYNSYLPIISSEDQYDQVSARGFAFGYFGSVILLVISLIMIQMPELVGLDKLVLMSPDWIFGTDPKVLAICIAFLMVGLWWIGFAQITFKRMPDDVKEAGLEEGVIKKGFKELKNVWEKIKLQKNVKRFLLSYFFYTAGVQTILYMAATFAEKELSFSTSQLIMVILILQIVAIGGAYFSAFISKRKGNRFSLSVMLVVWIIICVSAYIVHGQTEFFVIAGLVGLVMGGIQSLSRSTFAKLIEERSKDLASYFSFYDVLEKMAIVFGTFTFGFVEQITGGMRQSILTLGVYFIIGLIILNRVQIPRSIPKKALM